MERYFLFSIVVTLVGITSSALLKERRVIAAISTCENGADHTGILTPYTKLKTSAGVVDEKKIYKAASYKNSVQKIKKNWRRQVDKMPGSTNPRVLYNILRPLPMGKPYFIQ